MKPRIIAHGGAWYWDDKMDIPKREAMYKACSVGREILLNGGYANDAVEQTVIALENDPLFDAGTGGYLNRDGFVQLDALFVDGSAFDFGAVAALERIKNPIQLARKVLEQSEFHFFVGKGAEKLAEAYGIQLIDNSTLVTDPMETHFYTKKKEGNMDTVGAVAIDQFGNVAAGTSTSGAPYKPAGRVGDSPIFGAGAYGKNNIGTVGATGNGENILRLLLSKYTFDLMAGGMPAQKAANKAILYAEKTIKNSMCGIIAIDNTATIGIAHSTPKMALAWLDNELCIQTAINMNNIA